MSTTRKKNGIAAATREVLEKSDAEIERETSEKWFKRAVACYRQYESTGRVGWLTRFEDYFHESLEHAALARDGGKLVGKLEKRLADEQVHIMVKKAKKYEKAKRKRRR